MLSRLIANIVGSLAGKRSREAAAAGQTVPAAAATKVPALSADEYHARALALAQAGDPEAAAAQYAAAIAEHPGNPGLLVNASNVFKSLGRIDQAREQLKQALAIAPDLAGGWYNLGILYQETWWLEEALEAFLRAHAIEKPRGDTALCRTLTMSIGLALQQSGQWRRSRQFLEEAAAAFPQAAADYIRLALFTWVEDDEATPEERLEAHVRWAKRYADPVLPAAVAHRNTREPERPIRVGFVSGDFRSHAVSIFFEPLLRHHDRNALQVTCYDNTRNTDAVTEILKGIAPRWCSISDCSDEALAAKIRDDGIDVLVDLSGHTARNRLNAFALKPAPIQITWLGSRLGTGMAAMDYRLTDAHVDPPGISEGRHRERLLRLSGSQWCYGELHTSPEVSPLPLAANGHVTFGSFNLVDKLNDEVQKTWAEILNALPGSRLVMVGIPFGSFRDRLLDRWQALGISKERIDLHGYLRREQFQAAHHEVDIALDSFPYNGGTTTCESLWMGVPVLAIAGTSTSGRTSISLLTAAGLQDWLAPDREGYVRMAIARSADPDSLARLRAGMRNHLRASPLMDGAAFARDFEGALSRAWRAWCSEATGAA